jgi:hypothetical protein
MIVVQVVISLFAQIINNYILSFTVNIRSEKLIGLTVL